MFLKRLWQKQNAQNNSVNVAFINQNILQAEDLKQQFDIIVSNPPYVRNLEKKKSRKRFRQ
jgi:release factor glutamine methyltransferase